MTPRAIEMVTLAECCKNNEGAILHTVTLTVLGNISITIKNIYSQFINFFYFYLLL